MLSATIPSLSDSNMLEGAPDGERRQSAARSEGTRMTDTERDRALLDEERSRLIGLKEKLTAATEDVEREPTGDPSAGGHLPMPGPRCSSDPETCRSSTTSMPSSPTSSTRRPSSTTAATGRATPADGRSAPRGWPPARRPGSASTTSRERSARSRPGERGSEERRIDTEPRREGRGHVHPSDSRWSPPRARPAPLAG